MDPKRKHASKCILINDNFQNFKCYGIPRAQLVIADIPYNIGSNFYGSSPEWYVGGDNKNGESKKAGKSAFNYAKKHGFANYQHLTFCKNYSAQVLKANMRIVGATEHALLLYRDKLPKFNNEGKMIFDWIMWERDGKEYPKIHPTQKPIKLLKNLIRLFTDPGDVVIDPVAGSGATLRACQEIGRDAYGFEVSKHFYRLAKAKMILSEENAYGYQEDQITGQIGIIDQLIS